MPQPETLGPISAKAEAEIIAKCGFEDVAYWSKSLTGPPLFNARAETVAEKPSFRTAFKRRRCLVPADGFYEWQVISPKQKQPQYITLRSGQPFAFAGLWESWHSPDGQTVESCTILTTSANAFMAPIHDRIPTHCIEKIDQQLGSPSIVSRFRMRAFVQNRIHVVGKTDDLHGCRQTNCYSIGEVRPVSIGLLYGIGPVKANMAFLRPIMRADRRESLVLVTIRSEELAAGTGPLILVSSIR